MEKIIYHYGSDDLKYNLEYFKRDEIVIDGKRRRFWFRNKYTEVYVDLYGRALYEFLENHEIGDIINKKKLTP